MYPFGRMFKELAVQRRTGKLALFEVHQSRHICWPWDLDPWMELNNGRTLTLYDLGRIPLAVRLGMVDVLRRAGWALTVAGVSVRYRRRVRLLDRIIMRSRLISWDERFLYLDQSMWIKQQCANHILVRLAITDRAVGGIVPPARMIELYDGSFVPPPLPEWVQRWVASEQVRPWPPEMPSSAIGSQPRAE